MMAKMTDDQPLRIVTDDTTNVLQVDSRAYVLCKLRDEDRQLLEELLAKLKEQSNAMLNV